VNVRNRDDVGTKGRETMISLDEVAKGLAKLKTGRSLENKLD
jgi:threonyl-tRNA synthetase